MALLDGFKLVELNEKAEESRMTIGTRSLKFNRGTARNLGLPDWIHFFINDKRLQVAITPAKKDDEDAVAFAFKEGTREMPIIVKEPAVLKAVKQLTVLEKEGMDIQLTINGTVYMEEKTIIYDLTEATEEIVKLRKRRKRENSE